MNAATMRVCANCAVRLALVTSGKPVAGRPSGVPLDVAAVPPKAERLATGEGDRVRADCATCDGTGTGTVLEGGPEWCDEYFRVHEGTPTLERCPECEERAQMEDQNENAVRMILKGLREIVSVPAVFPADAPEARLVKKAAAILEEYRRDIEQEEARNGTVDG